MPSDSEGVARTILKFHKKVGDGAMVKFARGKGGAVAVAIAVMLGGGIFWKTHSSFQADEGGRSLQTPALPNIDNVTGTPRFHARRSPKGYTKGNVESISFSPDGRTILSAAGRATVKLWDKATGRELVTAEEGRLLQTPINGIRFSPDGTTFVGAVAAHLRSKSGDEELAVVHQWNVKTGEIVRTFEGQHRSIDEVSFSPDGTMILSVSTHGIAELWDVETGDLIRNIEFCYGGDCTVEEAELQDHMGHRGFIHDASFSPDGATILSASLDGTVKLWDPDTGDLVRTLGEYSDNEDDGVISAHFSPDGTIIAASNNSMIELWNGETGERLYREEDYNFVTGSVAFNPNGSTIAIAADFSFSSKVKILSAKTGEVMRTFDAERLSTGSLAFSPNGNTLALGNSTGIVSLWNPETGQRLRTLAQDGSSVDAIAFSPDGNTLAIGQGRAVRFWNLATGEELSTVAAHTGSVSSVAFGDDDKTIISSAGNTTKSFDAMTGKALSQGEDAASSKAQSQNDDFPAIIADKHLAEDRHWVPVIRDQSGRVLRTFQRHAAEAADVTLSPGGNLVAAVHRDGVVKLWNAETGAEVHQFQHRNLDFAWGISFSADGKILASLSGESIQIWDVETGKAISTLEDTGFITSDQATFSADGTMVAAFDNTGLIMVWEVDTGRLLGLLGEASGESGWATALQFNSDGSAIAAGYEDGSVKAWDLNRDSLRQMLDEAQSRVSQISVESTR